MARIVKPSQPHFAFEAANDDGGATVIIGFGKRSYLWIGPSPNTIHGTVYTVSGRQTLRKLARTILKQTR